jgi:hypothetical protein
VSEELEQHLARETYESRQKRMGKCRTCGEPVLWGTTEHGRRVPLDPVPVLDLAALLPEGSSYANLYVPKGTYRVLALDGRADGAGLKVYRVHNDGQCIDAQRVVT